MSGSGAGPAIAGGIFLLFIAMTVAGALIAVGSARVIRSVCGLALCCLGQAGVFCYLQSPFLALMEILIYVGAVCVTIVFAVMLAEPEERSQDVPRAQAPWWGAAALAISGLILWGLARLGREYAWEAPSVRINEGSVKDIGIGLLSTYSLAFELVSLVLLLAILGALVIAREGRSKS